MYIYLYMYALMHAYLQNDAPGATQPRAVLWNQVETRRPKRSETIPCARELIQSSVQSLLFLFGHELPVVAEGRAAAESLAEVGEFIMDSCIDTRMQTYIHTTHITIHVCTQTCVYVHAQIQENLHTIIHTRLSIQVNMCVYIHRHLNTNIYTYKSTHTHIYIYMHAHTFLYE